MKRSTKRFLASAVIVGGAICAAAFAYDRFSEPNRTLYTLHDTARDRDVPIQVSASNLTFLLEKIGVEPKVAIVSHGNTVRHTEYSFIGKILFNSHYVVVSIQHDLPSDPPLSQTGYPYVGRLPAYQRAAANIDFVIDQMKTIVPHADYGRLTLLGHSSGGDISMYYAMQHPERVVRIVTLDNLRVPLLLANHQQPGPSILSIRSNDWKPDPEVVPSDEICRESKIELIKTNFQHVDMSDRGPEAVKAALTVELTRFLSTPDGAPMENRTLQIDWGAKPRPTS